MGTAITPLGFTITDTINVASWEVTGTIPPGLVLKTVESGGQVLTGPARPRRHDGGHLGRPMDAGERRK